MTVQGVRSSSPAQLSAAAMRRTGLMGVFSPQRRSDTSDTRRGSEEGYPLLKQRSFDSEEAARRSARSGRPPRCPSPPQYEVRMKRHQKKKRDRRVGGLYCQYFAVGVIYGGLPATMFGVFLGWMNVPGYVYATASTLIAWPWSLKFLFGAVNDCLPIGGYRRKPYMVLGWLVCFTALSSVALTPLPEPFWCARIDSDGNFAYVQHDSLGNAAMPCNPRAPEAAGTLTFLMTLASFGYCVSDCAADGLTVTLARREPASHRGKTQTTVYLVRTLGNVAAVLVVGLGMNSWKYNGTFQRGLSFNAVAAIFALVALVMIPVSWFFVHEPRMDSDGILPDDDIEKNSTTPVTTTPVTTTTTYGGADDDDTSSREKYASDPTKTLRAYAEREEAAAGETKKPPIPKKKNKVPLMLLEKKKKKKKKEVPPVTPNLSVRIVRRVSFAEYRASVWALLRSRAMLTVVLYQLLTPLVGGIFTTAAGEVKQHWARVKVLQNAAFSLVGLLLFSYGLHIVKKHFLGVSWRTMTAVTTIFLNFLDMPFTYLTVFDVIRNQYFFLGEILVAEIPAAANFVISTFVVVEMSEAGSEGLVYGLLTTTGNLGAPVAQAISDQLFSFFQPSLSDPRNYQNDDPAFRNTVAASFTLSYFFAFASLLFLPLLPEQKDDAQKRKRHAPAKDLYAWISIILVILGLFYSFTINVLAVWSKTSCLRAVGGPGCLTNSSYMTE